jgi:hypothetical protein
VELNSIKDTMVEVKSNQMIHGKLQLLQRHYGKAQIKSNDLWQASISLKKLW